MIRLPMHRTLEPLAWLEGTWRTDDGHGKFPTMKDFKYCAEFSFTSVGQPMFNFIGHSWHPGDKRPMHRETGFLKPIIGTNQVSLILAHNFSLVTIEQGEVLDKMIQLNSISIQRANGAKPPSVTQIRRQFTLVDDCLEHVLCMATTRTPHLTEHIRAMYVKCKET